MGASAGAGHWVCGAPGVLGVLGVWGCGCAEPQLCQVLCAGRGVCVAPGVPGSVCARLWVANVPRRVSIVSEAGQGTLTIRDVKEADQGAYTCEAINTLGMVFGIPDSILTVTRPGQQPLPSPLLPMPPTPPWHCHRHTLSHLPQGRVPRATSR